VSRQHHQTKDYPKDPNIRDNIGCIDAWRSGDKNGFRISKEEIVRKAKTKKLEKVKR